MQEPAILAWQLLTCNRLQVYKDFAAITNWLASARRRPRPRAREEARDARELVLKLLAALRASAVLAENSYAKFEKRCLFQLGNG